MSKTQSVFNLELCNNLACNLLHSIFSTSVFQVLGINFMVLLRLSLCFRFKLCPQLTICSFHIETRSQKVAKIHLSLHSPGPCFGSSWVQPCTTISSPPKTDKNNVKVSLESDKQSLSDYHSTHIRHSNMLQ